MILRLLAGAVMAAIVSALAARARTLTRTGAIAAATLGTVAVAAGWSWGILLVVFFTLTSALSAFGRARSNTRSHGIVAKGSTRDAVQVLCNGAVFGISCIGWIADASVIWLAVGAGAIAAAAADSWATEIGVPFGGVPRSVVSGKRMNRGASGGVTLAGSAGGLAGAAAMAGTVLIIGWPPVVAYAAVLAGVIGMLIDSVLGATVQARRLCVRCGTETEQAIHHCGRVTEVIGGVRSIDNDAVNALATFSGAMAAGVIFHALA